MGFCHQAPDRLGAQAAAVVVWTRAFFKSAVVSSTAGKTIRGRIISEAGGHFSFGMATRSVRQFPVYPMRIGCGFQANLLEWIDANWPIEFLFFSVRAGSPFDFPPLRGSARGPRAGLLSL